VKSFKNFKEVQTLKPGFSIEHIFGGALLGVAGADFVCFYDWALAKVHVC
jgi:coatomer subunit beta'